MKWLSTKMILRVSLESHGKFSAEALTIIAFARYSRLDYSFPGDFGERLRSTIIAAFTHFDL
jgi:hypothetical protein